MKHALRQLGRAPAVSMAVVLSIGIALGANAAILTIVDAVLVRPLPYPQAGRLVELDGVFTRLPLHVTERGMELSAPLTAPEIAGVRAFSVSGAYFVTTLNVGLERPERLRTAAVTSGFFDALGVRPALGQVFTDENASAGTRLLVISWRLWRRRFQSDPEVIGASIPVNGRPYVVTGVLPEGIDYPEGCDVWIPYASDPEAAVQVTVPRFVARLTPTATIAGARTEILGAIRDGALTRQDAHSPTLRLRPLREALVGDIRPILALIAASAFLVLLVACLNSANLLLGRMVIREREFVVRRALGASTGRLLWQVLGETAMLTALAAVIGVVVAFWMLAASRALMPATIDAGTIALGHRTLAVVALLAVLIIGLCGLPAAFSAGTRSVTGSAAASSSTESVGWRRFRSVVVMVQIAAALAILVTASAIVRTVHELASTDLGARNESAIVMEVLLPGAAYESSDRMLSFHRRVRDNLRNVPEIEEAGATNHIPGSKTVITPSVPMTIDGGVMRGPAGETNALRLSATPGYFAALGIDLLAGRTFEEADGQGAPLVAVVSESYARAFGVNVSNILGHRVQAGLSEDRWAQIVGVVRDIRMRGPESDWQPAMYLPFAQVRPNATTFLVAKVRPGSRPPIAAIRSAISAVDPTIPLYNIRTLGDLREDYLTSRRFAMASVASFGLVAFTLAMLGLYAVVYYMVRLRTKEIGIRMAIGASPAVVRRQVLLSGTRHTLAGVILGSVWALGTVRVVAASVPGLKDVDGRIAGALCIVTFLVSIGAAWFPAKRAAGIDPLLALRAE